MVGHVPSWFFGGWLHHEGSGALDYGFAWLNPIDASGFLRCFKKSTLQTHETQSTSVNHHDMFQFHIVDAEHFGSTTKFHHIEPVWHDVCWLNDVEVRSTSQNISNLDWIRYSVTTVYLNVFCKQAVIHMASARTLTWNVRQEASRCLGSSYTIWIDHSLCSSWTNGYRKIWKTCFRHRICCGLECWRCLNRIELGELFKDVLFTT